MMATPRLGEDVHYVSKIGDGVESPATIIRTRRSTIDEVIERWGPVPETVFSKDDPSVSHETAPKPDAVNPELSDYNVDLAVQGLGKTYREYDVPRDARAEPGTWHAASTCPNGY